MGDYGEAPGCAKEDVELREKLLDGLDTFKPGDVDEGKKKTILVLRILLFTLVSVAGIGLWVSLLQWVQVQEKVFYPETHIAIDLCGNPNATFVSLDDPFNAQPWQVILGSTKSKVTTFGFQNRNDLSTITYWDNEELYNTGIVPQWGLSFGLVKANPVSLSLLIVGNNTGCLPDAELIRRTGSAISMATKQMGWRVPSSSTSRTATYTHGAMMMRDSDRMLWSQTGQDFTTAYEASTGWWIFYALYWLLRLSLSSMVAFSIFVGTYATWDHAVDAWIIQYDYLWERHYSIIKASALAQAQADVEEAAAVAKNEAEKAARRQRRLESAAAAAASLAKVKGSSKPEGTGSDSKQGDTKEGDSKPSGSQDAPAPATADVKATEGQPPPPTPEKPDEAKLAEEKMEKMKAWRKFREAVVDRAQRGPITWSVFQTHFESCSSWFVLDNLMGGNVYKNEENMQQGLISSLLHAAFIVVLPIALIPCGMLFPSMKLPVQLILLLHLVAAIVCAVFYYLHIYWTHRVIPFMIHGVMCILVFGTSVIYLTMVVLSLLVHMVSAQEDIQNFGLSIICIIIYGKWVTKMQFDMRRQVEEAASSQNVTRGALTRIVKELRLSTADILSSAAVGVGLLLLIMVLMIMSAQFFVSKSYGAIPSPLPALVTPIASLVGAIGNLVQYRDVIGKGANFYFHTLI